VRVLNKGESADFLFFTDSCTAYDPRIQNIARAFARILNQAGVDFGILGAEEMDSGNEVRRMGEEGLFQQLAEQNRAALAQRKFRGIVTADPHALNALKNDYELPYSVLHSSELLAQLCGEGRIRFTKGAGEERVYTLHDPCYLGRHNGVFEAPRKVLGAIPGVRVVEMKRSRSRSFCCGGGGLYLWYEPEQETERMAIQRIKMAEQAGANVIVTACPFCLINFEDAIKTSGREQVMEAIDLIELTERLL
jgi:Fe-S oxidoreductase